MCNKVSYPTKHAAMLDAKSIHQSLKTKKHQNKKHGRKLVPYQCKICNMFHLTTANVKHRTKIVNTANRRRKEREEINRLIWVLESITNNSSEPVSD